MNYTIYNKTSEDMSDLKDESISCIFSSPPYALAKDYEVKEAIGMSDEVDAYNTYLRRMLVVFRECFRVLQPGRHIGINIGFVIQSDKHGRERKPLPFHIFTLLRKCGFLFEEQIIWRKSSGMSSQKRFGVFIQNPYPTYYHPGQIYEPILIFKKPGHYKLTDKQKEQNKLNYKAFTPYQDDVWYIPADTQTEHPAPFPVGIPKVFFQLYSLKGETVLDCFGGSGTSMIASRIIRRNCILYEINPNYINLILERCVFATKNQNTLEVFDKELSNEDTIEVIRNEKDNSSSK